MPARWDSVTVDGSEMRCYVSEPAAEAPSPGLIVTQHAGGVDDFVQAMVDRFAGAGYVALAPDLYHRDPKPGDEPMARMSRLRDARIVADVTAAIAHLKGLPNVRGDRLGITGFCMGGRVAYLVAAHSPHLGAAVVFYGGNIMVPWGEGPPPFDLSGRIQCPVLGLFGEDDTNPSPADVAKLDGELTRLGRAHEFHSYGGAGHGFMHEARPSYRAEAARDAWSKCVAWFDRCLK